MLVFLGFCLIILGILLILTAITMLYHVEMAVEMVRRGWFTVDDLAESFPRLICEYFIFVLVVENMLDVRSIKDKSIETGIRPWNMEKFEYRVNIKRPSRFKKKVAELTEQFSPDPALQNI